MARWNSSTVRYIGPQVREVCQKLPKRFTSRDVYEALNGRLKRYPTYQELTHGLHKFPFIEKVGMSGSHTVYQLKGD